MLHLLYALPPRRKQEKFFAWVQNLDLVFCLVWTGSTEKALSPGRAHGILAKEGAHLPSLQRKEEWDMKGKRRLPLVLALLLLLTLLPARATGTDRANTLAAGGQAHSLAVQEDGTVLVWGDNSAGQLGAGRAMWPRSESPRR